MNTVNIATFILDDDAELLDIIKETIEREGITNYRLFTDENLFIAGLNDEIHVCVVDHLLNVKTGLDILREIKTKNDNSFVIAYTGIKDPKVIINYVNSGVDRFVDKDMPDHLEEMTKFLKAGLEIATRRIDFSAFIKTERDKLLGDDKGTV